MYRSGTSLMDNEQSIMEIVPRIYMYAALGTMHAIAHMFCYHQAVTIQGTINIKILLCMPPLC